MSMQILQTISPVIKFDIFYIVPQNKECGYTLEPPRRGDSNTCKPLFYYNVSGVCGGTHYIDLLY